MDLKSFDELWVNTEAATDKKYEEVPDGTYKVTVDRAEWKETKQSGKPYFNWGLKILDGQYKNQYIWKSSFIGSAMNMKFFKKDLSVVGAEVSKLSELDPAIFLDVALEVKKVTKNDFSNVYFNKKIDAKFEEELEEDLVF